MERKANILILLLEDEEPTRVSYKELLSAEGYEILETDTGAKALELVKKQHFDIFLVDYKLPDMTGTEFIRQALEVSKDAVPVVVTALSSLEIAVEAMRMGAHDYLVKPVDISEFKRTIENILFEKEEARRGKEVFQKAISGLEYSDENAIDVIVENSEGGPSAKGNIFTSILLLPLTIVKSLKRFLWDVK
ncbi:MAG: response regulator [Endomicrobiales bacterium]|nr:response regulator [Endomicrobiales bacterium]